jgi:hypothetical protein
MTAAAKIYRQSSYHSRTGDSVTGFRKAFLDITEAGITKAETAKRGKEFAQKLGEIPMRLINVIDQRRDPARGGKEEPTKDPAMPIKLLAKFSVGSSSHVDTLVGDESNHPRVQPEYPPEKWGTKTADAWSVGKSKKGKPSTTEKEGKAMQNSIIEYNKSNGGLLTPCFLDTPAAGASTNNQKKGKANDKKCKRKPDSKIIWIVKYFTAGVT